MSLDIIIFVCIIIVLIIFGWICYHQYKNNTTTDNPDYLEQVAIGRDNFLRELVEHTRLHFSLPVNEDLLQSLEMVETGVNRFIMVIDDMILNFLIKWDKSVKVNFHYNQQYCGENCMAFTKTFRLKNNTINWTKLIRFYNRALNKVYSQPVDSKEMKLMLSSAAQISRELTDEQVKTLLFEVANSYDFIIKYRNLNSVRMNYVKLISFLLKKYPQEFLDYLKKEDYAE